MSCELLLQFGDDCCRCLNVESVDLKKAAVVVDIHGHCTQRGPCLPSPMGDQGHDVR